MKFTTAWQTAPVPSATPSRLPLRPSPGPEPLPEPSASLDAVWLLGVLVILALGLWCWRRGKKPPVPLSPQQCALLAFSTIKTKVADAPRTAFVETTEVLRRYWTAMGQVPAETATTPELLAALPLEAVPVGVSREQISLALQRTDLLKFADLPVTSAEAAQWSDLAQTILTAPLCPKKTASS